MRIEMMLNTATLPPKGLALVHEEMERRVFKRYPAAKISIRKGTNNSLVIYAPDKDKKAANKLIENMFDEAEDWLY